MKCPACGCSTRAGSPVAGSVKRAARPTGTADAGPMAVPAGWDGAAVDGAAVVGFGDGLAVAGGAAVTAGAGGAVVGAEAGGDVSTAAARRGPANRRPAMAVMPPAPTAATAATAATLLCNRKVRRSMPSTIAVRRGGRRAGH